MVGNVHTHYKLCYPKGTWGALHWDTEFPNALEDIAITEKDAEKCSVYYNSTLRAKVECCTVWAVLFPLSLTLNTKQMECKIFQLVAATIKVTKHLGKKPMLLQWLCFKS